MKIKNLNISGIGGIDSLNLDFNEGLNLICGPNGVGKTTILECISHSFGGLYSYNILKKKAGFPYGEVTLTVEEDNKEKKHSFKKESFHPYEKSEYSAGRNFNSKKVITIKTNRNLEYRKIDAIKSDIIKSDDILYQEANSGISGNDIKDWFINRFLWSAHPGKLTQEQENNLQLAQSSFTYLDEETNFFDVNHETYDIMVKNRESEIYLEYLSSGYKSALYILLGIIKEIELRFKESKINASNFDGIILIDEIDLHLHPKWQGNLILTLKKLFPLAQIIATTHSPSMIQVAESNEVIVLTLDTDMKVSTRKIDDSYSFKGWTIEEILEDVMGLESLRSKEYLDYIKEFDFALDNEDKTRALVIFEKLKKILHPKNPMLKLLKLDLTSLGGIDND